MSGKLSVFVQLVLPYIIDSVYFIKRVHLACHIPNVQTPPIKTILNFVFAHIAFVAHYFKHLAKSLISAVIIFNPTIADDRTLSAYAVGNAVKQDGCVFNILGSGGFGQRKQGLG